ncbi:MAG: sulfurtransferase TusA family protein [Proteobacteria bacterium]|nr:sulfurtransferase TusA family protein [Pseudomonadota bacterium]MBU1648492.1 sulfurtransferase TusA family protein [Pseudomonadota bacterium]
MSDQKIQETIAIDMRGQICPACLLVAMDTLNKHREALTKGLEKLCIITDNREATTTIPTTARNMGYSVTVTKIDSFYQICVGRFTPDK